MDGKDMLVETEQSREVARSGDLVAPRPNRILVYRALRKAVWEQATLPPDASALPQHIRDARQKANQALLHKEITDLCNGADLRLYQGNSPAVADAIWRIMWTRIQNAGVSSTNAARWIAALTPHFDNWSQFANAGWNKGGALRSNFCNGKYASGGYNPQQARLHRTVESARKFAAVLAAGRNPIDYVQDTLAANDVWNIQANLLNNGYRADITALHLMMDLGYQVIKPDIVMSDLFRKFGWLHQDQPSIPADITYDDLRGNKFARGTGYGTKYLYNSRRLVYETVVDAAIDVAAHVSPKDLKRDIGWVTDNPTRELDIFLVKFGQLPQNSWGLFRQMVAVAEKRVEDLDAKEEARKRKQEAKEAQSDKAKAKERALARQRQTEIYQKHLDDWIAKEIAKLDCSSHDEQPQAA